MVQLKDFERRLQQLTFSRTQQQAFLEDFSVLLEDGVSANQALRVMAEINEDGQRQLALQMQHSLTEGKGLSTGMHGYYPAYLIAMIQAGEEGGTLLQSLQSASQALTTKSNITHALISTLSYPIIVICLGFGVSIFINNTVLRSFADIKPVHTWPELGQKLAALANFIEHWWIFLLLLIVLLFFVTFQLLQSWSGPARAQLDRIIPFSFYRHLNAARTMSVLGLLLSNGIILKRSLDILKINATPYLLGHLLTMDFRLSGGKESIAEVLDSGLIPQQDMLRLRVVAQSRGFEYALMRLGEQALKRNESQLKLLGRVLGGIFLAIGAGLAAFMIFAVYGVGSFVSH